MVGTYFIIQTRGRHKTTESRIPDPPGSPVVEPRPDPGTPRIPSFVIEAGSRYPPDPQLRNQGRIPVPPGSPVVESRLDPGTPRIPYRGTQHGLRYSRMLYCKIILLKAV